MNVFQLSAVRLHYRRTTRSLAVSRCKPLGKDEPVQHQPMRPTNQTHSRPSILKMGKSACSVRDAIPSRRTYNVDSFGNSEVSE